jgi:peptide/nickel transport system permease protein
VIASLNFIGLGSNPPIPNWGSMIQEGSQYIPQGAWWIAISPGVATLLTIIAFNLIADNLEYLMGVGKK